MRAKLFKLISYLLPIGLVFILSLILLFAIKVFQPNGSLKSILGTLLYIDFTGLWYGSIPYILFLGTAFLLHTKLKHSGFNYSHLYSPMLFAIIFFLFWFVLFEITGDHAMNTGLYFKTFLLPISLYVAIGGYIYLGIAGILFMRWHK